MGSGSDVTAFIGSYAPAERAGIRAVRIDVAGGAMTEVGAWAGVTNPSFVVLSDDRSMLYAVSETADDDGQPGRVVAFEVTWRDGLPDLAPAGEQPSDGDHPCHLGLDPDGRWIAVSNYGSGSVTLLPVGPEGRLSPATSVVRHEGRGPHPTRQRRSHAHSATPTLDGRHVIVADLGTDRVVVYEVVRTSVGPTLTHRFDGAVAAGAGPRHTAVHPDGNRIVVANELDCTLTSYVLDDGTLVARSTVPTVDSDAPDTIVAEVCIDGSGRRALASNRGDDTIAVFDLADDGGLEPVGRFPCGGHWPRHFAVLPGDRHVLVANERSDRLSLLALTTEGTGLIRDPIHLPVRSPTYVAVVGSG